MPSNRRRASILSWIGWMALCLGASPIWTATGRCSDHTPTATVSKDTVSISVPLRHADSTFHWNVAPARTAEHSWIIDIDLPKGPYRIGVVQCSQGPPAESGTLEDLLLHASVMDWQFAAFNGPLEAGRPVFENGSLRLVVTRPEMVQRICRQQPRHFVLRTRVHGEPERRQIVAVTLQRDPGEAAARRIVGPFSADTYAVYQTILARSRNRARGPFYLLTPVVHGKLYPNEELALSFLEADDETREAYLHNRTLSATLSSLVALHFSVVERDSFLAAHTPGRRDSLVFFSSVSRIGFNEFHTQALVYGAYGSTQGEFTSCVYFLEKVEGQWLISRSFEIGTS